MKTKNENQKGLLGVNLLLILIAIIMGVIALTSCTKEKTTPQVNIPVVNKQLVTQNDSLLGVWAQDSISTGLSDSLNITITAYNDIPYNTLGVSQSYESKTWLTSGDSLYTKWNSVTWSYKYIISGKSLILSSPVNISGGIYTPTKYYYTKVR